MPGKDYNSNNDSDMLRKEGVILKRMVPNNFNNKEAKCNGEINISLFSNMILYKNHTRSTSPIQATRYIEDYK
ncbi:hypothetical protein K0M31_018264 [Melipona bicolor]|uniref:Uncharacterized protein n=1 Tax=Melipona bicolor TaxID=60889 RepID=A0AA40FCS7_9HYME|nr:hypothetical protein K0M31_018264 [Melipona bicolor]